MNTNLLTRPTATPDVVDDLTRREFITGLTAAGLLAACGQDRGPKPGARTEPATRTFVDEIGEVEIPVRPRRVVTLDAQSLEVAVALGAPVIGSTIREPSEPFSDALAGRTEGIAPLGQVSEPNLEALAALEPDLIVAQTWAVEGFVNQLREVAPLVQLDYWVDDAFVEIAWEDHLRRVADALGRGDEAERALSGLDDAVAAFREDFDGDPAAVELSIIKARPADAFIMLTPLSFQGQLVERLGFSRPEPQRATDTDRVELSYERLDQADGDLLLLAIEPKDEELVSQMRANALWEQLEAVREDRVREVDGQLWLLGGSVLAGQALIAELRDVLDM